MASYKDRLRGDLERWIGQGLVPADSRGPILDSVADSRRPDALSALAMIGVLLAGAAIIAFIGANWDGIPRVLRFGLLLAAFLAACAGGAWAAWRDRPNLSNGLLALAAAIYAASIGLTGQIFDIAGDPKTALLGAGLAAGLLALAGRSSGAGVAALALIGFGDFTGIDTWWLLPAALSGCVMAWLWRSRPTAHAAGIALIVGAGEAIWQLTPGHNLWDSTAFLAAAILAAGALAARFAAERGREEARVFYGWLVWGALFYFVAASSEWRGQTAALITHRVFWLLLSGGVVTLGRIDRHGAVMAAGVVSLMAAMFALMVDLGVNLMTASLIFAIAAVLVLAAAWLLRGRRPG